MEQYTGKSIYKSVAIGPVYFYSRGEQQVKRCKAEDSQAQLVLFETARDRALE